MWAVALTTLAAVAALPTGPTASLAVDDPYPVVGQAVHFNASASAGHDEGNGRIVAYNFSFGDGIATGWQASPLAEHMYVTTGAFEASALVVDARGSEAMASVSVHVGTLPPPTEQAPDLVPVHAQLTPTTPQVNDTVRLTVVVLNRGGADADMATVVAYDLPPNGTALPVSTITLSGPVVPSQTASVTLSPFVPTVAGEHVLRILITDVSPAETNSSNNELDVRMTVLPSPSQPNGGGGGGGGGGSTVSPLVVGLAIAATAAGLGAAYLFLRPAPVAPLEPPPPSPPDRSPPPIWPP